MKITISTTNGSTIIIDEGYAVTIDGGAAGSLEDAIKNFPQFAEDLWAAAHLEMKSAQDECAAHHAQLIELQATHEAMQNRYDALNESIIKAAEPVSEEEQIAAEVASRVAAARREAEIQRRMGEALA
jgi:hypothetical protein